MQHNIETMLDLAQQDFAELTPAEQNAEFTQQEKCFVVQFLADRVYGLATINTEAFTQEQELVRITDSIEVAENYVRLMSTAEYAEADEPAKFTFTLADAGSAIGSYDTEYRDCITEQFTDACVEYAYKYMPACKNMLHLPARIFNAY